MTINSVSSIASTPFCGLATQTYNVLTTGTYTMQVNCTIPWQTSDTPGNVAAVPEVQTIIPVADSSGSLNSTFWKFNTAGNVQGFYVWYNINSAGVDPAPAGLTGIQVLGATGASAATLATATRDAINAVAAASPYPAMSAYLVASVSSTTHVNLTYVQAGATTAASDGTAATGFAFSVGTTGTFGTSSGLTLLLKHGSTVLLALGVPTPTQASMSGAVQVAAMAGDTLTFVTSSLATADQAPNAVKGVLNVFSGPL